jgi:hypothetical protein
VWDHDAARDEGRACPYYPGSAELRASVVLVEHPWSCWPDQGGPSPLAAGGLQAVRDWARVRPGQTVLVNGASSRPPWSTCSLSGAQPARPEPLAAAGRRRGGARDAPLRLRLLDPDSAAARQRAVEIGESPESFASGIRFTIARLRELAEKRRQPGGRLLRPTARLAAHRHRLDPVRRTFVEAWEAHRSPLYKLTASPAAMLQRRLRRTLEELREHAKRIIWIICR